jgi:nucleotide-binding universal stress UspA family protein
MIALKKILVATDFGEPADVALEYGRQLARQFGASLDVLHVTENVYARAFGADGFASTYPEFQRDVDDAARRELNELVGDEDRIELRARGVIVTSKSPAVAIAEYARDNRVDLIVMGTHGRGAVAHLLMGSVAERVVRTAPCPVLTVRHPEHEFVLPDALVAVERA